MTDANRFQSSFFTVEGREAAAVLTVCCDQLTEEENLEQFDQDFSAVVERFATRKIVLDLHTVTYITSAAIGKLITFHRRLGRYDGSLVLCGLRDEVRDILETSHLLNYFRTASDVPAALTLLDE